MELVERVEEERAKILEVGKAGDGGAVGQVGMEIVAIEIGGIAIDITIHIAMSNSMKAGHAASI